MKAVCVVVLGVLIASLFVPPSQGGDCSCADQQCSCCVQIKVKEPKIDVPACVNISYNPQTLSASLVAEVDDRVVYNKTVSVHDPDVCFGIPFIDLVDLCLEFSNMQYSQSQLTGCLTIAVTSLDITLAKFPVGCFDIRVPQQTRVTQRMRMM